VLSGNVFRLGYADVHAHPSMLSRCLQPVCTACVHMIAYSACVKVIAYSAWLEVIAYSACIKSYSLPCVC